MEIVGELSQGWWFMGRVMQLVWNFVWCVLDVSCMDQLQQCVEVMEIVVVDVLVGGVWFVDVFELVDGCLWWDYVQECLISVIGSLDCLLYGVFCVILWFVVVFVFEFGLGFMVYGMFVVELVDLSLQMNRVEIECDY